MRLLLSGGGTAGHVLPHIAVITELVKGEKKSPFYNLLKNAAAESTQNSGKNRNNISILYIGSKKGPEKGIMETWVEKNLTDSDGTSFNFISIPVGKWRRYFDIRNFIDPFRVAAGFLKSLWLIHGFRPDVMFSKGGYVSVPVTLAAWVFRVPIILHDSDAKPSLTTRICGRFANKICLGYKEALPLLSLALQKKCAVTGIPLRHEIFEGKKAEGYRMTGFTKAMPVVLVMGGSLGSEKINRAVFEALRELLKIAQVVHLEGDTKRSEGSLNKGFDQPREGGAINKPSTLSAIDLPAGRQGYKLFKSVPNEKMPHLYAIADVVITRGGANSLAELTALGKKMVVIPLGSAASHGDQLANAEVLKGRKSSTTWIIMDEKLNTNLLARTIEKAINDKTSESKKDVSFTT